ncbi:hypothetical protein KSP39_PZI002346 [Platanthera zijinensis]|uniref:Uncharacterized protein n=1 Tax=Platanthera zijinensis TaxID=2320716 RepID=A0AAP0GED9_9ASPA
MEMLSIMINDSWTASWQLTLQNITCLCKSELKHQYLLPGHPDELRDGSARWRSELGAMDFRLGHEDFCSNLLGGALIFSEQSTSFSEHKEDTFNSFPQPPIKRVITPFKSIIAEIAETAEKNVSTEPLRQLRSSKEKIERSVGFS